ncbi:hypothetical protein SAY86_016445 [Trapa natans]|uniref:non-specific serine/threonine protein kinase n=1 Tax=Trapa natans TaxID=22666 RepID=A0AAN7R1F1_TRANT|nr:hypothetical protein SAY86_016445 [Trapa natans]
MERHRALARVSTGGNAALRNYRVTRNLGHGAFSKVKAAIHLLTGCQVAIKILNRHKIREKGMEMKVEQEIKISKMLVHPHVVRLYEVIETATDIYVILEYAEHGDLYDYIVETRRVPEEEARKLFQQLISGLQYCHQYRVAHRDLKPENLLLDSNGNLKIADFGLSNIMLDGHFLKTCCGSPNYAAPEVISGKLYAGPEVDVWSCGVILYALLVGALPFDDESLPNLYRKIRGGVYNLSNNLPPGARNLISRMLVVDPIARITIPEICNHPWFKVNLPCYLAAPSNIINQMRKINVKIVHGMVKMGFNKNFLMQSLHERIHNEGTVSYYLLLDKYYRSNNHYNIELENCQEATAGAMQIGDSSLSTARDCLIGIQDHHQDISTRPQPHLQNSERWGLGLQFGSHPLQIMAVVLGALQSLNVYWKKIGQYNMKCKWSPSINGHSIQIHSNSNHTQLGGPSSSNSDVSGHAAMDIVAQNTVKFELQVCYPFCFCLFPWQL